MATEGNLPTPEYLRSHRNNGAPPFVSVNPMGPGPALPSPYYEQMRLAHIGPLQPKSVAVLKDVVREQAHEQLKRLLPRGKFDLSLDYAAIVAARMVCHVFSLPLSTADEVLQKVGAIGRSDPAKDGKKSVDLSAFFTQMKPYIVPLVQARRAAGADGSHKLVDGLINHRTQPDERALGDIEIADQLICAMVGGMEAVPKVTSRGIMELWRRPDQLKAVRADLEKNLPVAVDEIVRFCAPAQYTFRRTLIHEFLTQVNSVEFLLEEAGRNAGYFQKGWISLPVVVGD